MILLATIWKSTLSFLSQNLSNDSLAFASFQFQRLAVYFLGFSEEKTAFS